MSPLLDDVKYHWTRRHDPRSRIIGWVGKFVIEGGLFLLIGVVAAVAVWLLGDNGPVEYELVSGWSTSFNTIVGGLWLAAFASSFCDLITEEESPSDDEAGE